MFSISETRKAGVATGWKVRGSNAGRCDIFRTRPTRHWSPSSLLYNKYRISFLRAKRPGRGVNHPHPSSAKVKERVELYLYSSAGLSLPVPSRAIYFINTYTKVAGCCMLRGVRCQRPGFVSGPLCRICGGQSSSNRGFSPSIPVFHHCSILIRDGAVG
jgi:hypothetical protein